MQDLIPWPGIKPSPLHWELSLSYMYVVISSTWLLSCTIYFLHLNFIKVILWKRSYVTTKLRTLLLLGLPLVAQTLKNPMQETQVRSLGWEDPPEKGMATHSCILACRILWTRPLLSLDDTNFSGRNSLCKTSIWYSNYWTKHIITSKWHMWTVTVQTYTLDLQFPKQLGVWKENAQMDF